MKTEIKNQPRQSQGRIVLIEIARFNIISPNRRPGIQIRQPGRLRNTNERRLRPRSERLALKAWGWLAARPALYRWLVRRAALDARAHARVVVCGACFQQVTMPCVAFSG